MYRDAFVTSRVLIADRSEYEKKTKYGLNYITSSVIGINTHSDFKMKPFHLVMLYQLVVMIKSGVVTIATGQTSRDP